MLPFLVLAGVTKFENLELKPRKGAQDQLRVDGAPSQNVIFHTIHAITASFQLPSLLTCLLYSTAGISLVCMTLHMHLAD
jgi:hypothetical protein